MSDDRADHVFVYGTLREGHTNPGRDVLEAHARHVDTGTVAGTLYDLGAFPAMVEPERDGDRVAGDLYRLTEDPQRALERLDRYEGARGPNPLPYERRRATVAREDGSRVDAWTYVWTDPISEGRRVPGGDWLEHTDERS